MDLNRIVTQYKICNHEPDKELALLLRRLSRVDVHVVPLIKDLPPGGSPLEGIWVTAELVSPQLSHDWFLPYGLPTIGEEEADRMAGLLVLPFARLLFNGENPNRDYPKAFYNRHFISDFFNPVQGTRFIETDNAKAAAVITERKGRLHYTELQLTY